MKLRQCTDTARRVAIYIEAARLIEAGEAMGACTAIIRAGGLRFPREECIKSLRDWYEDDARAAGIFQGFWGQNFADDPLNYQDKNTEMDVRNARVLMLCFMAAITERP
jgi:hypothetical protein